MSGPWPVEEPIRSWKEFFDVYQRIVEAPGRWVFRGQDSRPEALLTSLDRALLTFLPGKLKEAVRVETRLLREFKRRAHQYLEHIPPDYDTLEWLSLMRHYQAPTRLLDWTYSFFVAAYFALRDKRESYAILALDADWCRDTSNRILGVHELDVLRQDGSKRRAQRFERTMRSAKPRRFVYPVNPFRLNDRLTIQQAVFLCPGDISRTFQENLDALRKASGAGKPYRRFRIPDQKVRQEILRHLHRMNMDSRTLMPGLEGFATSLNTMIALPWIAKGEGDV